VVKVNLGEVVDSRADFGELLDAWLPGPVATCSPSTVRTTQVLVGLYIRPSLGKAPLRKLTTARLGRLYAVLRRAGGKGGASLAPRTVRRSRRSSSIGRGL
jgi:hypothetical protein